MYGGSLPASYTLEFGNATPYGGTDGVNSEATGGDLIVSLLLHPDYLHVTAHDNTFKRELAVESMLHAAADDFEVLEAAIRGSAELFDADLLARFAARSKLRVVVGLDLLHRIEEAGDRPRATEVQS